MSKLPHRQRRAAWALVLLLGLAATVGLGWKPWSRPAAPMPPALDPAGIDPAVWGRIENAREAVLRAPESDRAWGRLGMILLVHQLRDEAVFSLARAERLNPRDVRWPYYQAMAVRRSDPETAIAHLRRAVAVGDDEEAPRLILAELLIQLEQLDEAEAILQAALEGDPRHNRARLGLARIALQRGDPSAGEKHLLPATTDPRTRKTAYLLLAEIRQRRGDRGGAEEAKGRADNLPDDVPWPDPLAEGVQALAVGLLPSITRAAALIQRGDGAQAVPILQRTVEDYPDSSLAWTLLGRAWLTAGNLSPAERALDEAIRRDPDAVEAHFYLGVVRFEGGRVEAALPAFRRASELKPDYAEAWYNLGHCRKRRGERAGAREAFRTAVACKPQFADARINLGELLAEDGQIEAAREQLQIALRFAPEDKRARQLLDSLGKQVKNKK
jgi:tetratricopeptide (TPR) repeat protein